MNKLLLSLMAFLSCGGAHKLPNVITEPEESFDWAATTMVEYRYGDSSVAPEYHRSYTISITESHMVIAINSYGNVLLKKEYPNTPADFKAFKEELSKKGIKKRRKKKEDPCDGGTSETIRLYKDDVKYFDAYVYHCSGDQGTLVIPAGTAALICRQLPENVDSLIESTFPKFDNN